MLRKILVLLLLTSPVFGQGFSSSIARRIQSGSSTPSSCNAGPPTDIFYNTGAGLLLVCNSGVFVTLQSDAMNLSGIVARANGGTGNATGQLTASQGTITASNGAFQATGALNNAGVTFCIVLCANYTNTASNSSSLLMQLQIGSTNKTTIDESGNLVIAGSATFGASGGIGGQFIAPEGTAAAVVSGSDVLYADSTAHCMKLSNNNGSFDCVPTASSTTTFTNKSLSEAQVTFTDITTGDVSSTKHGYAPKNPNDATKYLDGTGAYSVPAGSGGGTASVFDRYASYSGAGVTVGTTNVTKCSAFITASAVSFSNIGIRQVAGDGGAGALTDVGILDSTGALIAHIGAQTMNGSNGFVGHAVVSAPKTLTAATRYYFCETSTAAAFSTGLVSGSSVMSPLVVTQLSGTTTSGALNGSNTPPADSAAAGNVFAFLLY